MKTALLFFALILFAGSDTPPERIRLKQRDFMPEGIEYDARNARFLLSSLAEGTVFAVADDGTVTPFIEDEALISSVGLEIDEATNRLLVVNADATVSLESEHDGRALLGIYDLATGERLHMVDLGELAPENKHFANDVAVDDAGNAYVTDSLAPLLYKVTPEGEVSILLEDDALLIEGFGGNGIVYHPDGYLIIGISGVELYKVPLDAPDQWTVIETDEVVSADGMLLHPDGTLIVASQGSILALTSEGDWANAHVLDRARRHPATTITFCGDAVYAIHPESYEIVRVQFSKLAMNDSPP
jgi:sugar lactone lactonase YvrE